MAFIQDPLLKRAEGQIGSTPSGLLRASPQSTEQQMPQLTPDQESEVQRYRDYLSQTRQPPQLEGSVGLEDLGGLESGSEELQPPLPLEGSIGLEDLEEQTVGKWAKDKFGGWIRPTLQTAGATAGAVIGGGMVGTAAIPVPFVGTLLGAGLGYASMNQAANIAENLLDMREDQPFYIEIAEAALDVPIGMAWEAGAMTLPPVAGGIFRGGKWTGKQFSRIPGIKQAVNLFRPGKKPQEVFIAALQDGAPLIAKDAKTAEALQNMIPGLEFTTAQATKHKGALRLEQKLAKESPEFAKQLEDLKETNTAAIRKFIEKVRGKATPEAAREVLESQEESVQAAYKQAEHSLKTETAILSMGDDLLTSGANVKKIQAAREKATKLKGSKKFNDIGDSRIYARPLLKTLRQSLKSFHEFEITKDNVPPLLIKATQILKNNKGFTNIKALQGLRSDLSSILDNIQNPASGVPGNKNVERRLAQVIKAIDKTFDSAVGVPKEYVKKLKEARKFWREEYIQKFKKGVAGEILKKGPLGDRVHDADVITRYFKKGPKGKRAASEFKTTMGESAGSQAVMKNAVRQSLVGDVYDAAKGEVSRSKLKNWLNSYYPALKELGLEKEFDTISKVGNQLDEALKNKKTFDKSLASKMLKSDPGQEIQMVLKGTNKEQKMLSLMRRLGGQKRAVEGVQASLIDEIMKVPPKNVNDLTRMMDEYDGVLKAAFSGQPRKLKALKNYQEALSRVHRGKIKDFADGDKALQLFNFYIRTGIGKVRAISSASAIMKSFQNMAKKERIQLLTQLALDPSSANELRRIVSTPGSFKDNTRQFHRMLTRMGLSPAREAYDKYKEERK